MKKTPAITLFCIAMLIFTRPMVAKNKNNTPLINNRPVNIHADNQKLDLSNGTVIFSGNVKITQDNIHLTADNVIINDMQKKKTQRIIALGSPAKFHQCIHQNKTVEGYANKLIYDVKENNMIFIGNVKLIHNDNTIRSQIVRYNIADQQISADSYLRSRVRTTIIPNQLSELKK